MILVHLVTVKALNLNIIAMLHIHCVHDHPSYLCCPGVLSMVGDPLTCFIYAIYS